MDTLKKFKYYQIYILLAVSVLATLLTGYMIYEVNERREVYTERVVHTLTVIESANRLLSHLIEADTGRRGYLLTGVQESLEIYQRATERIDSSYVSLLDLTAVYNDTPSELLDDLGASITFFKSESTRILNLFDQFGLVIAIANVQTEQARELMDNIRDYNAEIINIQQDIFDDHTQRLREAGVQFQWISLLGLLFIVSTTVFAALTIRRKARDIETAMQKIDDTNAMLYHAREKEIMKNRYLGIVAHDLRNPLQAVLSFTELIQNDGDNLNDEQRSFLGYIFQSAEQMKNLTSEMLDIQKIESGVINTQLEELHIHTILDGLIAGHQQPADQKNIQLILNDDFRDQNVITVKSIFLQVADNLLSNAIKFSPPGSTVTIHLQSDNKKLILSVSDEGPGISDSEKHLLFKRFQQLSNRPTAGESSTGLGLSIIKDRIESIGGRILCNSSPGEGSEFIAEFPIEY